MMRKHAERIVPFPVVVKCEPEIPREEDGLQEHLDGGLQPVEHRANRSRHASWTLGQQVLVVYDHVRLRNDRGAGNWTRVLWSIGVPWKMFFSIVFALRMACHSSEASWPANAVIA